MSSFADFATSLQMRDVVKKLVVSFLNDERPRYRYATVVSWVRSTGKCTIVYNGETSEVIVNMGSIRPSAIGQVVRIEGIGTDKYISDVIGTPDVNVPVGASLEFGGSTAPVGFLLEDGASYLRASYPDLFAVIGTTFGSVDGTHFNVPNRKGAVGVGYDSSQTEFNTLGKTGGEKAHTLTAAETAAHTHKIGHGGGGGDGVYYSGGPDSLTFSFAPDHINTASAYQFTALANTGGDGAHNNLQPYIALNYIIKY